MPKITTHGYALDPKARAALAKGRKRLKRETGTKPSNSAVVRAALLNYAKEGK